MPIRRGTRNEPDPHEVLARPNVPDPTTREQWAAARLAMEVNDLKTGRRDHPGHNRWKLFEVLAKAFSLVLRCTFTYGRGRRNALDVELRQWDLALPKLPPAFDGLRILQLSDLHLDGIDGLTQRLTSLWPTPLEVDLCVLTGDFRTRLHGPWQRAIDEIAAVLPTVKARDGVFAILGNHDSAAMVPALEALGVTVLVNEHVDLERRGQRIRLLGTDDVHYYYTPAALRSLEAADEAFTIGLIHSPELAPEAAAAGVDLYLCGHTHCGQVCLPGGLPLITHVSRCRRFARGLWRLGEMTGLTSHGVGATGLPVRFFCRPQADLVIVRQG